MLLLVCTAAALALANARWAATSDICRASGEMRPVGLVLGKQIGITLFSWIAVRSGRADLPDGVTWSQIYGGACLAGIGFTMSLFVTELAFNDAGILARAKVGILAASLVAALWGAVVLHVCLPKPQRS